MAVFFIASLALCTHLSEALAAVYGTVGLGLEGNLCLAAAACASSGEELTGTASIVLTCIPAGLAALGLVLEATLCVEFLLTCGEYKLVTAILARQCLVLKHLYLTSLKSLIILPVDGLKPPPLKPTLSLKLSGHINYFKNSRSFTLKRFTVFATDFSLLFRAFAI